MQGCRTVLGFGGLRNPRKILEPRSGENAFLGLLGWSGDMLPRKILKIEPLRLAKNAFPT